MPAAHATACCVCAGWPLGAVHGQCLGFESPSNRSEHVVVIDIGCVADVNDSGMVSVQDILDFVTAYFAGCP